MLYFGVLSFIILWPLSGLLAVSTNNEGDALAQLWAMGWGIHALTTDPANLFNGNIFYPYPNTLAFADHLLAQALQTLPVYLLTGNLVLGYGLLTYLSFVLSGWGVYLLLKELTGNRAAGLFAGMVFAFASYRIGHLSQLNLLSTQWIPFCFLFLRRLLLQPAGQGWRAAMRRGWGPALALALFFTLNGLSTFYYFFYLTPLLALYFLAFHLYERRWPRPDLLVKLVVAGLLAGLLILPTLLPYATVVAEQGAERTPRDVERLSANYRFYLGATENNLLWGKSLSRLAGAGGERALFPGALAYLLALVGLAGPLLFWLRARFARREQPAVQPANQPAPAVIDRDRRRERWTWLALGLFALLMSFGWTLHLRGWDAPGLYRLFYEYFPGWVAMRAAVRYGVFVLLALAVLGGLGVDWLSKLNWKWPVFERRGRGLAAGRLALTGLLLGGAFLEYRYDITYTNPNILPNPPAVYRWLADPARAGVVLELPGPPDPANPASIRSYYSTFHWQPYVNGIASYIPPVETDIARLSNEFPSPESLAAFQGIEVRWLVYHLADENTPLPAAEWQRIEARLARTPQVKLAQDFPQDKIKVYELTPDPWMRQARTGLPPASDVIISDYRRVQPVLIELFQTLLRRDGHRLYGSERAGYRFLNPPPPGRPVQAGLFAAGDDPALWGFDNRDLVWSGHGLTFYRRQERLAAAYDPGRETALTAYRRLTGPLDISIEKDGLKFNGQKPGSGTTLDGDGRLNLLLSSFKGQGVRLNDTQLELPPGLSLWRSERLKPGDRVKLEPAAGQELYLERAELVTYRADRAAGLEPKQGAALLTAATERQGDRLNSRITALVPPLTSQEPGNYILTLDIYRRPWGTHPGGHFGTYSVALAGQAQPRQIEFSFDPVGRKTEAKINGAGMDVGSEVFKAAGDGDWAVFLTLRRSQPGRPDDFPLVGLARLFEFSLDQNRLSEVKLLPERELVLLPPLAR